MRRVAAEEQRVTVGCGARGFNYADGTAATAAIVDDNGAESGLELVRPQSRDHIVDPAWRRGDDEANWPAGVAVLGARTRE